MQGNGLINYSAPIRPTRGRLLAAMGVSTCSVALLLAFLGSLVDFAKSRSKPSDESGQRLTVHIKQGEGELNPELTMENQAVSSLPQEEIDLAENPDLQLQAVTVHSPEPPPDPRPTEDWWAIPERAARASIDKQFRNEEIRASMWRQSHSIMFQPAGNLMAKEEEPVISDFRFKPEIHVVGLGVKIGSCFIGVPLAGVPVEKRTVGISLVVCAKKS